MIRKFLRRVKRGLNQKPYLKDPKRVGYWFDQGIGTGTARVVQIGSNDGKTGDPLYPLFQQHLDWSGLLVEPIPAIFARLSANYPDEDRFDLANVAIGENGNTRFYYVDEQALRDLPNLPYWYDQLGSFDRNHIVKELDGVLEPYIKEMEVETVTLTTLFERYDVTGIDILHVDAEGYDWKVLQQLDLSKFQPAFILFEYHHLSATERMEVLAFLAPDYEVVRVGIDWLAVRHSVKSDLLTGIQRQFPAAEG